MSLCCRSKRFRAAGLGGSSGSALQVRQNEIEKKAPLKLALRKRERIERERDGGGMTTLVHFDPLKVTDSAFVGLRAKLKFSPVPWLMARYRQ